MAIRYVDIEPGDGKAKLPKAPPRPAPAAPPADEAPAPAAAKPRRRKK